jgi:Flp pilus assembly protein TadD
MSSQSTGFGKTIFHIILFTKELLMTTRAYAVQNFFFDDILELLAHLEGEHDTENHLYRGQLGRHTHYWVDENGPIKLEAIYPSDFRFITKYSNPAQFVFADIPAARQRGRTIRDLFITALIALAEIDTPKWSWLKDDFQLYGAHLSWLNEQMERGRSPKDLSKTAEKDISLLSTSLHRLLWSLAQHYLIATALTDVTFSPLVAAWFATQQWDEREPPPTDGTGVIYRFNRPQLETVLTTQSGHMIQYAKERGDALPPELFLVDIQRIPKEFAGRPAGQHGGSVYGFDQPAVLKAIMEQGCLDIFEFRHTTKADSLKELRRTIIPENDPFDDFAVHTKKSIDLAIRAEVVAASSDGPLVDISGTSVLSSLKLVAHLMIDSARLKGRIPLGGEYKGYHFVDIQSSGHHGYAQLLVVVNENTNGILGYVSLEPLDSAEGKLPITLFVTATWFNNTRVLTDLAADPEANETFLYRATQASQEAVGKGPKAELRSALEQMIGHFGGPEPARKALKLLFDAGNIDSGVNLGVLLAAMGQFHEGVEILKSALAQGSANAAFNLGTIYLQRKDFHESEIYLRKAMDMGDKEARYSLGTLFEAQGDYDRAEAFYRLSYEIDRDQRAPNNLGIALVNLSRFDEAKKFFGIGKEMGDDLAAYNLTRLFPGND